MIIVIGVLFILSLYSYIVYYGYTGRKAVIVSIFAFMVLLCTCHNCYMKGVDDTKVNNQFTKRDAIEQVESVYQVTFKDEDIN